MRPFQGAVGRAPFDGWAEDTTLPESLTIIRSPPKGHTAMGSWCCICRFRLFCGFHLFRSVLSLLFFLPFVVGVVFAVVLVVLCMSLISTSPFIGLY